VRAVCAFVCDINNTHALTNTQVRASIDAACDDPPTRAQTHMSCFALGPSTRRCRMSSTCAVVFSWFTRHLRALPAQHRAPCRSHCRLRYETRATRSCARDAHRLQQRPWRQVTCSCLLFMLAARKKMRSLEPPYFHTHGYAARRAQHCCVLALHIVYNNATWRQVTCCCSVCMLIVMPTVMPTV